MKDRVFISMLKMKFRYTIRSMLIAIALLCAIFASIRYYYTQYNFVVIDLQKMHFTAQHNRRVFIKDACVGTTPCKVTSELLSSLGYKKKSCMDWRIEREYDPSDRILLTAWRDTHDKPVGIWFEGFESDKGHYEINLMNNNQLRLGLHPAIAWPDPRLLTASAESLHRRPLHLHICSAKVSEKSATIECKAELIPCRNLGKPINCESFKLLVHASFLNAQQNSINIKSDSISVTVNSKLPLTFNFVFDVPAHDLPRISYIKLEAETFSDRCEALGRKSVWSNMCFVFSEKK